MSTPTVIEISPRPEPVVHDTFIEDLRLAQTPKVAPRPVAYAARQ